MNILYKRSLPASDRVSVVIPSVGEILENEEEYYETVSLLTAMPIDFMVQLDDIGVDFTTINDYDLFLMLFNGLREKDTRLVFGDLDLNKFEPAVWTDTGKAVLYDKEDEIVIDRVVYTQIANILRKIHHIDKDKRTPGNAAAKDYLLRRAREKAKRKKKRGAESQLERLIIAMVNTEQYKYDYEGTRELSIYQFNESVRQIQQKVDYDNKMHGVYAGTVDPKKLSQGELNWLTHN